MWYMMHVWYTVFDVFVVCMYRGGGGLYHTQPHTHTPHTPLHTPAMTGCWPAVAGASNAHANTTACAAATTNMNVRSAINFLCVCVLLLFFMYMVCMCERESVCGQGV